MIACITTLPCEWNSPANPCGYCGACEYSRFPAITPDDTCTRLGDGGMILPGGVELDGPLEELDDPLAFDPPAVEPDDATAGDEDPERELPASAAVRSDVSATTVPVPLPSLGDPIMSPEIAPELLGALLFASLAAALPMSPLLFEYACP